MWSGLCLALTAAALLTLPGRADAAEYPLDTVSGLLASCAYDDSDDDDDVEVEYQFGTCIGYIKGVGNIASMLAESQGRTLEFCVEDDDSDNEKLRDVVVDALENWQGDPDANPAPIVLMAVAHRFPCPADPGPPLD